MSSAGSARAPLRLGALGGVGVAAAAVPARKTAAQRRQGAGRRSLGRDKPRSRVPRPQSARGQVSARHKHGHASRVSDDGGANGNQTLDHLVTQAFMRAARVPGRAAAGRRHSRLGRFAVGLGGASPSRGAGAEAASGSKREASQLRAQGESLAAQKRCARARALRAPVRSSDTCRPGSRSCAPRPARRSASRRSSASIWPTRSDPRRVRGQLGARIRELYDQGDPDPITLAPRRRVAERGDHGDRQPRPVRRAGHPHRRAGARGARAQLRRSLKALAARAERSNRLTADAEDAQAALLDARDAKRAYLAEITRQQKLNAAELAGDRDDRRQRGRQGRGSRRRVAARPERSGGAGRLRARG